MYSAKIRKMLDAKKIRVGDHVLLEAGRRKHSGILMPKTDFSDPDSLVIKLDNGYNVGIDISKGKIKLKKVRGHDNHPKPQNLKFDPSRPKISLIATGGTITSRVDYRTGGVYALEKPEDLLENVPELAKIANISIHSPFTKMSEDMNHEDWQEIARETARELNSGKKGVIITHGTDTLHYTSAALSFFLKNLSKPVVLIGSQRSTDRGSSDGYMNLICGSHVAASNIAEVGVCMHAGMSDDYCSFIRGTKVKKLHTSRRDAFRPVNDVPIAKVWQDGKMEITNKDYRKRSGSKIHVDAKFEPKVAILKAYPGSDPEIIDHFMKKDYRGFVIEGTGLGHVPTFAKHSWTEKIKKYSEAAPFVITSQTIFGRVNPYVYTNLRKLFLEAKAIPGEDMLTEVAYIKLGWVLGHTKKMDEIRKMMLTSYAGEISPRSDARAFSVEGLNE